MTPRDEQHTLADAQRVGRIEKAAARQVRVLWDGTDWRPVTNHKAATS